jgi:aldehyde dehydrogenase (NAD+)
MTADSSRMAKLFAEMSYGPAPETSDYVEEWLKARPSKGCHFIKGRWQAPAGPANAFAVRNPATGQEIGALPAAGAAEVDLAVKAARAAFPAWSKRPGHERARCLYALARLIQKNSRFLAVLESIDNGKPIRETRDLDIPLAARHFYHHAGWAQLQEQEFPDFEALGVIGQIIPWNFPLLMLSWKIAPAIALGNTIVLKPAEYTSLTALYFGELCQEAGLPAGVVNIITGAGETGALLVEHPGIDKIAFTGSTEVGRSIRRAIAGTGKKLSLELGGKSPFIVFDDADLDGAVEGLIDAIWFNQGQVCCAGSRLLVEESVAEALYAKIRRRLQSFRIGDPLDKAIDMGALVDPVQHQRISGLVAQSVAQGACAWTPDIALPAKGCFYPPTLLTNLSPSNVAMQEEIFGPVLAAMSFRTLSEALSLANNSRYGLAATIWSENINRALDAASKVKAGVVWINTTNAFDAACGFGGYRESGFGREGGREGAYEYLAQRDAWTNPKRARRAAAASAPAALAGRIDQTPKNYIGGKQKRPDGARTEPVYGAGGVLIGRAGLGNRKDVRDAVEAAFLAESWASSTGHARAQILYFLAENLSMRAGEFAARLGLMQGCSETEAQKEVELSISRLFSYAAWADKYDGLAHSPPGRHVVMAMNEPVGVMGIVCPAEAPLLGFVSLMAPAIAMANRVVVIPSSAAPLAATDFYQVLETSDVPAGVVNIVTGDGEELAKVLADHAQVEGLWYFGTAQGSAMVERSAADNMKRTWVNHGKARDWQHTRTGEGREFLRRACEIKNIWLPYGD